MKKALITGITGQDGSYLAELLLSKGYEVHGIVRRVAIEDPEHRLQRIRHILDKVTLHAGSLESYASIFKVVDKVKPEECYHLSAQSFVDRDAYNLYALSGILFNHESPKRGLEYVTRKVTNTVAKIKLSLAKELRLGNLDAKRDWGYASDYVKAMWLMLQQDEPDDYVIATGETHSVKELVETAFSYIDLDWHDYVVIDKKLYRPAEIYELRGDFSKANKKIDWSPSISFKELIQMMVDADLKRLKS